MEVEAGLCGLFFHSKFKKMSVIAFWSGQKFKFPNDNTVYIFISIEFQEDGPVINYSDDGEEEMQAHGFYLSDLIHA